MREGNWHSKELVWPAQERLLALRRGESVLEVACGNGNFARRMAKEGANVVASDFSEVFLDRARARTVEDADMIDYLVLDATDSGQLMALGEERFDAAVCTMALFDMADIEPLGASLARLLKSGGRFVFSVIHPCFESPTATRGTEWQDGADGVSVVTHSVKIKDYATAFAARGTAILGEPEPHWYFHRPLSALLGTFFAAGFRSGRHRGAGLVARRAGQVVRAVGSPVRAGGQDEAVRPRRLQGVMLKAMTSPGGTRHARGRNSGSATAVARNWVASWHPPELPAPAGKPHGSAGICFTPEGDIVLVTRPGISWEFPAGRPEMGRRLAGDVGQRGDGGSLRGCGGTRCWSVSPRGACIRGLGRRDSCWSGRLWCADVSLDPWDPLHETTARLVVPPNEALERVGFGGDHRPIYERWFRDALIVKGTRLSIYFFGLEYVIQRICIEGESWYTASLPRSRKLRKSTFRSKGTCESSAASSGRSRTRTPVRRPTASSRTASDGS